MKITMDQMNTNQSVQKGTTSHGNPFISKVSMMNGYALDISGNVMDNTAYAGQGRTAEDVMQFAGQIDTALQKDYMTVMSNSMSKEDFAKLQEDGIHVNDMEIEEVVTIVDRIKATLLQAGLDVAGYTDTMDKEKLSSITGSVGRANSIARKLEENDMPVTSKNMEEVSKQLEKAEQLTAPAEGTLKYMIQNKMEPTIDNMYVAQFSGSADGSRQGRGYYTDEFPGYYAKKADEYHWDTLMPQIGKTIEEAGMEATEETIDDAKWLIEKGIPLDKDALSLMTELKTVKLPQKTEELMDAIIQAMASGKKAKETLLTDGQSIIRQAAEAYEIANSAEDKDICAVLAEGKEVTLRNLGTDCKQYPGTTALSDTAKFITARRQLEEVRLQMSVQANIRLLKSGFSIDTSDLQTLVEELKKAEAEQNQELFGTQDSQEAAQKASLYQETLEKRNEIPHLPAAVVGRVVHTQDTVSLDFVHQEAKNLQQAYKTAGTTYEALMTAPRSDLGDSIKKAFRNIDELLEQNSMELTEANRRAVRILGYNNMEVTPDNINAIKEADLELRRVVEKLTPQTTLNLIRQGENPLSMNLAELEQVLSAMEETPDKEALKYAKFLYKLEKNKEISAAEKDSYIGIYRMIRQLEKTDGAAIGSVLQENADLSFKNLLSAMRSNKQRGMNIAVDDSFGGLEGLEKRGTAIDEQIGAAFADAQTVAYHTKVIKEISDTLEPEKLKNIRFFDEMSPERLAEELQHQEVNEEQEDAYRNTQLRMIQSVQEVEDYVIQNLLDFDQPVTMDNLFAIHSLMSERGKAMRQLFDKAREYGGKDVLTRLEDKAAQLQEGLEDETTAKEAYEQFTYDAAKILEAGMENESSFRSIESIRMLYKQISLAGSMAKEENYEIPVRIDNELTSVNLRILHGGERGKTTITMDTDKYGKVAARLQWKDDRVEGYVVGRDREGLEELKQIDSILRGELSELGYEAGEINFVHSTKLNIQTFSIPDREEAASEISTKELYKIAKAFLTSLAKA